jgi:hypothetical protein
LTIEQAQVLRQQLPMNTYIIPAALVVAFAIIFFVSFFSKRSMRSLWLVFVLIFLATWSGQLWMGPAGMAAGGVAWIPLLVMGLIFFFFLLVVIPAVPKIKKDGEVEDGPLIAVGIFFWILIVLLIFSIAMGYCRSSNPVAPTLVFRQSQNVFPHLLVSQ